MRSPSSGYATAGPERRSHGGVTFTYKDLSLRTRLDEKFGLRLRIGGDLTEDQAGDLLTELRKKLGSAVKIVRGYWPRRRATP